MGGARALNIAVAGGGIGGITAALMLAKNGHRVTLHEKSDRLGGRLCFEELGRFRIDQGPTIVLLPDMLLELLREAGVDTSRISLLPCDPMYKIHYPDGAVFEKWHNEDRQLAELKRLFPADTDSYRRYMQEHDESFPLGKQAFLDRPFLSTRQAFATANIRLLLKMRAYRSVRARAAAYFQDPRLADAYSLQTLYIGGAPRRTPALYSFIPYAEQRFGVWYVKGGYASLLPVLQEAMAAASVEMKLRSTVTRIVVEEGSVKGLETQDGFLPYDKVIYNGDLPLLAGLVPGYGDELKKRRFTPSSGCLLVFLGTNRRWDHSVSHQFFLPPDFDRNLQRMFREGTMPQTPSFYSFQPAAIDPEAAPEGESVLYLMIPTPPASAPFWQQADMPSRIQSLADWVVAEAERRSFPGLRASIVEQHVRTPLDAQASGLFQGGNFGIAPVMGQSGWMRPQFIPLPVQGLYAVGASTHPGGGVPIVMQGAKLLADHIRMELEL